MQWPCASLKDADLGARTTLRVGGPVEWLLEPANPEELREAIVRAKDAGFTPLVLGGGANLVIDDRGLPGVVIATDRMNFVFRPMAPPPGADEAGVGLLDEVVPSARMAPPDPAEDPRLAVWAGVPLPKLCRAARDLGYSGLEKMAGVPGQVGGGIAMNAGGKDPDGTLWQMSDVVEQIRVVNERGEFEDIDAEAWAPGYRDGRLGDHVVAGAVLRFEPRPKLQVAEDSRDYLRRKNAVQPVTEWSAGCVFKNPDPEVSGGRTAGLLVDEAGGKGRRIGGAVISERHGNFLVNTGEASAEDVFTLIEETRARVAEHSGVELELEVKLWRRP
ncbi:MAG: FAD-binding protein [Planctomycetota bacterium]|nr:FAD-binding protein [Planctomycetota bacterium]